MGNLDASKGDRSRSWRVPLGLGALVLLVVASSPALATVYDFAYTSDTSTVRSPTIALAGGTAGSSTISSVSSDAATVLVTAGLTYYESAGASKATVALDPNAGASVSASFNAVSGSVSMTTTNANDVVVVVVSIDNSASQTVSTVVGGSPSTGAFALRQTATQGTNARVETWYATSNAAFSGNSVTVTLSASARFTIVAFAVSGANTAAPFDPNVTAPPANTGSGNTASATITTTFPNDFLFGAVAVGKTVTLSAGGSFTMIGQASTTGNVMTGGADYLVVTATQPGSTVSITWSGTFAWAFIGDAIIAGTSAPSTDTSISTPGSSGSFTLSSGSSMYLWTPGYTSGGTLYAGSWLLDLWASAATSGTLMVSIWVTNSAGAVTATVLSSGTSGTIGTTKGEVKTTFSGSGATIPSNGLIMVVLTAAAGGPASFTVYWGTGQLTNFQTPNLYNYVLLVQHAAGASYTVNLGVASSSGMSRLTNLTISFVSPYNKQTVWNGLSFTVNPGPGATLSTTDLKIQIGALASSVGSSSIVLSLKVLPSGATAYSMYTISLTVG